MKKTQRKSSAGSKPVTRDEFQQDIQGLRQWFEVKLVEDRKETTGQAHATEKRLEKMFDEKLEENRKQTVKDLNAAMEIRDDELQGAHEDEMAAVEGRKDAPLQWRSMPRRIKALEFDMVKVKDHLEIS